MNKSWDAIVIGTGPAGMAAATTLAESGARTLALDEQPELGGQIYRAIERNRADQTLGRILGADYLRGAALTERFRTSGTSLLLRTLAWRIDDDLSVWTRTDGVVDRHRASAIIIATGAIERPVPVKGWTLPGVMTIGALQVLLKSARMTPSGHLVLAGNGPLFYLFARQCLEAGVRHLTLLDTAISGRLLGALPLLPRALAGKGWRYLAKGLSLLAGLHLARVSIHRDVQDIAIEGDARAQAVSFTRRGVVHRLTCDTVGLHEGVIPHQQMTRSIGCQHEFDDAQWSFRPRHDAWGRTSRPGIFVAGDAGGIVGAEASVHEGIIAALGALHDLGRLAIDDRDRRFVIAERDRRAHKAVRPFIDYLYHPRREVLDPPDSTVVCRCETVSAGEVRRVISDGASGPNQAKAFSRCGMGPCQGRMCGPTVTNIISAEKSISVADVGYFRGRTPLKPITLGQFAEVERILEDRSRSSS